MARESSAGRRSAIRAHKTIVRVGPPRDRTRTSALRDVLLRAQLVQQKSVLAPSATPSLQVNVGSDVIGESDDVHEKPKEPGVGQLRLLSCVQLVSVLSMQQ